MLTEGEGTAKSELRLLVFAGKIESFPVKLKARFMRSMISGLGEAPPSESADPLLSSPVKAKKYRPDIDGLRAVAVLSVFLYHITVRPLVPGGFVGVDVFFVISGFLITMILVAELETSRFSLAGFYERRIRRIAPALFGMMAGTLVLGYLYLLPGEFSDYAKSLLAAVLSVSNFFFWNQTGYFAAPSSAKPLLHTWSLAVEEQFYLFFPLFLAAVYRFARRRLFPIILGVALLSLLLSVWITPRSPSFAFFWPFTRAWELLLGSMLSLVDLPWLDKKLPRNLASAAGLLMILFAAFRYTAATPFPGAAALLPCLGAALVIGAGNHGTTFAGRLLSLKPMVFTGLISYSLYLWHWPIIVFVQHGMPLTGGSFHIVAKFIVFAVSYLIAVLSWRFVERPFRRVRKDAPRRRVFIGALAGATIVAIAVPAIVASHGFPSRFSVRAQNIASYMHHTDALDLWNFRQGSCFLTTRNSYSDFSNSTCLTPVANHPSYLIVGDSHGAQLYYGLAHGFPELSILQATASGCKPTLTQAHDHRPDCVQLIDYALHEYLHSHPVSVVILAARWKYDDLRPLAQTITYLKSIGEQTIVVGPSVEYDAPLPRLLALSIKDNDPRLPAEHRDESLRKLDAKMALLASDQWHVKYLSYYSTLCSPTDCTELVSSDVPLEGDGEHLTAEGSLLVANRWKASGQLP